MQKEDLTISAKRLRTPAADAVAEFSQKREELAARVNRKMASRSDLEKLVGSDGRRMSEDNNRNFSLFMESLTADFHAEVLVETALWVFRAYRAHGFQTIYWPANLNTWMETLQETLSPEAFKEIAPFYAWLITHVPAFTALTDGPSGNGEAPVSNH